MKRRAFVLGVFAIVAAGLAPASRAEGSGCGFTLLSASQSGTPGDDSTFDGFASGDGRYVLFDTQSKNLAKGVNDGHAHVYLRDGKTGALSMPAVGPNGAKPNWDAFAGPITPDGRFITFSTPAWNFGVGNTSGGEQTYIRDLTRRTTTLVSVGRDGKPADMAAGAEAVTPDGRYVLFNTPATNMPGGPRGNRNDSDGQLYLRDVINRTTTLVSVGYDGVPAQWGAGGGAMSRDGRWIVFSSGGSNVVRGDTNETADVFLRDMRNRATIRISYGSNGKQAAKGKGSNFARITPDGVYVMFTSLAPLVPGDTNNAEDVFVYQTSNKRLVRVSLGGSGMAVQSTGARGWSISNDGRIVTFSAHKLDQRSRHEVAAYARDWRAGKTKRLSQCTDGTDADTLADNEDPIRVAPDGKSFVLASEAMNFAPRANSGYYQIYSRALSFS